MSLLRWWHEKKAWDILVYPCNSVGAIHWYRVNCPEAKVKFEARRMMKFLNTAIAVIDVETKECVF